MVVEEDVVATDVVLPDSTFTGRVIELLYEVAREVGPRAPEARYRRAFQSGARTAGFLVTRGKSQAITYNDRVLGKYRVDFLLDTQLVVEISRGNDIPPEDFSRTLRYLKDSGLNLALLAVFGDHGVRVKRVIHTPTGED